jgi:hypothetical protein
MATADQIAKAEETTRVAYEIISAEAGAREEKTARLRAARLAMERKAAKAKRDA